MGKPIELAKGDSCPNCGGPLLAVPAPTDAQRAAAARTDEPQPLPPHVDTATLVQRAELGELHRCPMCTYQTRFAAEPA